MMKHAQQRADRIVIMSARYGLIAPEDEVDWYDAYLPALTIEQKILLARKIARQLKLLVIELPQAAKVLSYLPAAYDAFLQQIELPDGWSYLRPFSKLPMMTAWKVLSNEIKFMTLTSGSKEQQ